MCRNCIRLRFAFQTLFLGLGATGRVGLLSGVHPRTGQDEEGDQLPGHRAADNVPLSHPVPE